MCRLDWRYYFGLADLQLFKTQLELSNHRFQLLWAATELHTTQLGDHHLQTLNLCTLGRDQSLQGLEIIRQGVGHESYERILLRFFSSASLAAELGAVRIGLLNQCPPPASKAAQRSETRCRWLLVARRSVDVPAAYKTDTSRRHPTTTI